MTKFECKIFRDFYGIQLVLIKGLTENPVKIKLVRQSTQVGINSLICEWLEHVGETHVA